MPDEPDWPGETGTIGELGSPAASGNGPRAAAPARRRVEEAP
jgi:hypothetical protein